jgi:CDP-4-dehydro-6-deoxyglucose reductase
MSASMEHNAALQRVSCRVAGLKPFNHEITQVLLQPVSPASLRFHAGQYINIVLEEHKFRPFSLANAPREDNLIELHIQRKAGGRIAAWLQCEMDEDARIIIEGPYGDFFIHESGRPIIMVAGGIGFAPIKALIEHMINERIDRTVYLYWGARTREGLYLESLARRWEELHENIHFIPVLSEEAPEPGERSGLVHEAVLQDFPSLKGMEVYVCGPVGLIQAVQRIFPRHGLEEDAIFSDMFAFIDNA